MGIWTDWEAQGTRISLNLLHDNQKPDYVEPLKSGMMSQDIFVEVSHGPTLIDNNVLLSDVSLRMATQGIAMVHNLICESSTSVGSGTDTIVDGVLRQRYTPYHIPHRTEVMGFMTILHGDNRFYNNIFIQKWPNEDKRIRSDSEDVYSYENRQVGTNVFDDYVTSDEWIKYFDMGNDTPDMKGIEPYHHHSLPVWIDGNVYLSGALAYKNEKNNLINKDAKVKVELVEENGKTTLLTNVFDYIKDYNVNLITSDTLGKAFEPEQRYENPDSSTIYFNTDFFGNIRKDKIIPGPFVEETSIENIY